MCQKVFQRVLAVPARSSSVLRLANDHEAAAFWLVERTIQRTKPRVGALGLKTLQVPEGTIERGALGRLHFRFDGQSTDFEPENRVDTRPPSDDEVSLWNGLQRVMSATKPVTDREWNLVSMRLGARILRRLPLGGVVTFLPDGTPPFTGSFKASVPAAPVRRAWSLEAELELLRAIHAFVSEEEHPWDPDLRVMTRWTTPTSPRQASHIVTMSLGHGRHHARGKWQRCPLCHTPVVKGLFNPRIPYGQLRPGSGAIRDLRGGYLSRLRETYLLSDPNSLISASDSLPETAGATRPPPGQSRIVEGGTA